MNTHTDKKQDIKSKAAANVLSGQQSSPDATFDLVDNRPESIAQRVQQSIADKSPKAKQIARFQQTMMNGHSAALNQGKENIEEEELLQGRFVAIQTKENSTGLPFNLKTGIESLSGYSMDDVKVHYNSSKPEQLNALAYAQGNDIHLGSGQEKHLPHEAWHVVQQAQGRVKPTLQMSGTQVNDDVALEKEADVMGQKALQMRHSEKSAFEFPIHSSRKAPVQREKQFAASTTFGLEIEFKNRMVSPWDYAKKLEEFEIKDEPLKGWKAGSDRGRPSPKHKTLSTVLEYESSVYSGEDWKEGVVNKAVSTAMKKSSMYSDEVREKNRLSESESDEQKVLNGPDNDDKKGALANEARKRVEDKQPPSATIQITTLGKRTEEHRQTLAEVSGEISEESVKAVTEEAHLIELFDAFKKAKDTARTVNAKLRAAADPEKLVGKAGAEAMEDLEAVTSVLIQSIVLAENSVGARVGTPKNLVEPLPRRIIGPPAEGFMKRLGIKQDLYCGYLEHFQKRVAALEEEQLGPVYANVLFTLAWFAKGAIGSKEELVKTKDTEQKSGYSAWSLSQVLDELSSRQKKKLPSLWHDIAESEPTLQDAIIKQAGKKKPDEWTAHEIRNILFAGGMDEETMLDFVNLLKKRMA